MLEAQLEDLEIPCLDIANQVQAVQDKCCKPRLGGPCMPKWPATYGPAQKSLPKDSKTYNILLEGTSVRLLSSG